MAGAFKKTDRKKTVRQRNPQDHLRVWAERLSRLIYGSDDQKEKKPEGNIFFSDSGKMKRPKAEKQAVANKFYFSQEAYKNDRKMFLKNILLVGLFVLLLLWAVIELYKWNLFMVLVLLFVASQLLQFIPWGDVFPGQERPKSFLKAVKDFFPPYGLFLFSSLLAVAGQIFFILHEFKPGALCYLSAILLAFGYEARNCSTTPDHWTATPIQDKENPTLAGKRPARFRFIYIVVPIGIFLWAFSYFIAGVEQFLGVWLWVASISIFMFGLWRAEPVKFPQAEPLTRYQRIGLAVIFIMAVLVRFYKLQDLPHGFVHDEIAQLLLGIGFPLPFFINEWNCASLPFLLNGVSCYLSTTFLHLDNCIGYKLVCVAADLTTIYLLFQFTRFCFGNRAGLFAAFLWTFSFLPIAMSHMTYEHVEVPMATVGLFFFLYRGLKLRRKIDFAWAGFFFSFGLYAYASFRIVPIIAVLFLAYVFFREKKWIYGNIQGLTIFGVTILAWLAPILYQVFFQHIDVMTRALWTIHVRNYPLRMAIPMVLQDYYYSAVMYSELCARWIGLPGKPVFDLATAACSIACLGIVGRRIKEPIFVLILLMAFLGMMPGALTEMAYPTARTTQFLPPVFMLAGLFLGRGFEATLGITSRLKKYIFQGLFVILLVYVLIDGIHLYFVANAEFADYAPRHSMGSQYLGEADEYEAARKEMAFDREGYAISGGVNNNYSLLLLNWVRPYHYSDFNPSLDLPYRHHLGRDCPGVAYLFFPGPINEDKKEFLEYFYPKGKYEGGVDPKTKYEMFWSYAVSRDEVLANQGLTGKYYGNPGFEGKPVTQTAGAGLIYDWELNSPVKAPFSASFSGGFIFSNDQMVTFTLKSRDQAKCYIDGKLVLSIQSSPRMKGTAKMVSLKTGPHRIKVETVETSGRGGLGLFWNAAGATQNGIIPSELLLSDAAIDRLIAFKHPQAH